MALGKEAEAISSFERYIEMAPALPYSYLRIAEIHMESENWPKALSIVNQGLDHADNKDILHIYRGHIAGEQEQFAKAEEEYRKALQLDPDDFLAVTFIATVS
ncbi:hypothetical protein BB776_05735 [Planococcus salinarum]|uniref:Tetratricopeptide repeat protein n=1 Tax=Planococcus salinarum TaxID=622695 RepID=A0ABX3D1X8_9BACL|nr:hypothetical protein BB776_05735 [Planococcus salinarum]